jgi:hypothetical protein
MWSKENLNGSYTFRLKAIKMQKYNQGLRNPNKKIQGDLDSISVPKLLEGGMGCGGMGYHHHPLKS